MKNFLRKLGFHLVFIGVLTTLLGVSGLMFGQGDGIWTIFIVGVFITAFGAILQVLNNRK